MPRAGLSPRPLDPCGAEGRPPAQLCYTQTMICLASRRFAPIRLYCVIRIVSFWVRTVRIGIGIKLLFVKSRFIACSKSASSGRARLLSITTELQTDCSFTNVYLPFLNNKKSAKTLLLRNSCACGRSNLFDRHPKTATFTFSGKAWRSLANIISRKRISSRASGGTARAGTARAHSAVVDSTGVDSTTTPERTSRAGTAGEWTA